MALVLASLGIVMGLAISLALARVLDSLLFQVRAPDPLIYAATSLLLLIVSALACFIPARRAARLSPLEALRHQWPANDILQT